MTTKVHIFNPPGQERHIDVRVAQTNADGSLTTEDIRIAPGDTMSGDLAQHLIVAIREGAPALLDAKGAPIPDETRLVTPDGVVPV